VSRARARAEGIGIVPPASTAPLVAALLLVALATPCAPTATALAAAEATSELPRAVALDRAGGRGPWQLRNLDVEGVGPIRSWMLRSGLATETRPFWAFWRDRPDFTPAYLQADLERVRRELEADGYYSAAVAGRLTILEEPSGKGADRKPGLVDAAIVVDRGEPVHVCRLDIDLGPRDVPATDFAALRKRFPIAVGDVFEQDAYEAGAALLTSHARSYGYPQADTKRRAEVDVPSGCATVSYRLKPGDSGVFGKVEIDGLDEVERDVVEREIAFRPGQVYDERDVSETVRRLRALRIFSVVSLKQDPMQDRAVPIRLSLVEGDRHEIRLGAGYSTDDGVRGLASWWDYNFFGGARQLGVSARVSEITRSVTASFIQPHFFGHDDKARLDFQLGREDESTYVDDFALLTPRIEWQVTPSVLANIFLGFHYDSLSGVSEQTQQDLGVFQDSGFTNSLGTGLRWQWLDDPVDPRSGLVIGLSPELSGGPLGGDFDHFRLVGDVRGYLPLSGDLLLTSRVLAGSVAPFDDTPQIPLWARFYAGGTTTFPVRGYGRRRVGPLSGSNDPLGGRSATVVSLELRHPIILPVWGVVFVDAGDVELSAWTLRPENVQTGVGFGIRASTPVGPIEADLGFGLNREGGDSLVQFAFTIGPDF
jgi:outer membrane protein assembly complex protein YaeT